MAKDHFRKVEGRTVGSKALQEVVQTLAFTVDEMSTKERVKHGAW